MRPLLIVLLILLAGCSDAPEAEAPTVTEGAPEAALGEPTLLWSADVTGCAESVLGLLLPLGIVQSWLPGDWVARDAQAALGTPVATGYGLVAMTAYGCDNGFQGGDFAALVEDPDTGLPPATMAFYEPQMVTNDPELHAALQAVGFNHHLGEITYDGSGIPGGGGSISINGTVMASWSAIGAAPQSLSSTSRFWQEVPDGLVYQEWQVAADLSAGIPASCALIGIYAEPGIESCLPGDAIVMQIPDWDAPVEFWFLPKA